MRHGYPEAWIIVLLMPKSVQWRGHPLQEGLYGAYANSMKYVASEAHKQGLQDILLLPILADKQIRHLGSMSHPDVETHHMMAEELAHIISARLGWTRQQQR